MPGNDARQTTMQAPDPDAVASKSAGRTRTSLPPSHLSLAESCLRPKNRRCASPVPSHSTIPSSCSDGPLSPHSLQSTVQTTPPGTALIFSHSREHSLDAGPPVHDAETLAILMNKTSLHTIPSGKHRRNATAIEIHKSASHRRIGSEDLSAWARDSSQLRDFGLPMSFEPMAEDEDEDLRAYREEDRFRSPNIGDKQRSALPSLCKNETIDNESDMCLDSENPPSSETDGSEATSLDGERASKIAKAILEDDFGLCLGLSKPPKDIIETVRACLDDISLSVRSIKSMGLVAHQNVAAGDSQTPGSSYGSPFSGSESRSASNSRKRPLGSRKGDDDDLYSRRDGSEDVGEPTSQRDGNDPKRKRVESYPCPFRKRNPYRFNCRQWEYCAKAPFKSISELKKHLLKYHQQQEFAYKCPRCHIGFATIEEWTTHMTAEVMCKTTPGPPSDMTNESIPFTVCNRLRARKDHFDWIALWQTLFPNDKHVPEPDFEPIVELHEVHHEVQTALPSFFQTQLYTTLETHLPSTLPTTSKPNASKSNVLHTRHLLGSALENLFQEFLMITFSRAKAHATSASQTEPTVPTRRQTPSVTSNSPRPSSLVSINERPTPRPILPATDPNNRLSAWSSTESAETSSSSSFRYSTSTFGQSQRISMVESLPSESNLPVRPLPSVGMQMRQATPMRELVLVENKRQRELKEGDGNRLRDSGVGDVGCSVCHGGVWNGVCNCGMAFEVPLPFMTVAPGEMLFGELSGDVTWESEEGFGDGF